MSDTLDAHRIGRDGETATPIESARLAALVPRLHRGLIHNRQGTPDRLEVERHIRQVEPLCGEAEIVALAEMVEQHLHGLGPLDELTSDSTVSEIMVNGPGAVWVERNGELVETSVVLDEQSLQLAIERIIGPLGLRLDRVVPFADARLNDGSRVHITIAPMAVDGPYLTIRRFADLPLDLAAFCSPSIAAQLGQAVRSRLNIVVTGATSAGKTSLLNALGALIGTHERIVTIEDTAELRLPGRQVLRLEARPANSEGTGEISLQTLVRNALRMRPDRIVVGEVRGAEAFDMVQALSTGHRGSLSTCHANGPSDAIDRLTAMVLMGGPQLGTDLALRQVRSAVDLVIHVERATQGRRRIASVLKLEPGGDRWLVRNGVVEPGCGL